MVNISKKTLTDLEFPMIREQLSAFCITEFGRGKALKLLPLKTPQQILFSLQQTQEYQSSAYEDMRIPNHGFDPVDEEIHLLSIENSVLTLRGFRKIARLSETVNTLLIFFKKKRHLYPTLYRTTRDVEFTKEHINNIHQVIDRFGEVKNEASPLLQKVRQSLHQVQSQIDSSFNADMAAYQSAGYLDDIRESIVDNNRVLAVSAMHRRKIKGKILGRSKSGGIVFIQPTNTLQFAREYNNLKYEEKEEIDRILKRLTEQIRPYRPLLIDYQDLLAEIDLTAAKVKYADTMKAVFPKITRKQELELRDAYHPLLYLNNKATHKTTYPQDIVLHKDNRIIVISGPNAGGKSITLKTVGLIQVMLQSGLFVPVHQYSRMCLFTNILSDIGDHQSIENHLSTYSYRLKNMRYFLKKCDKHTLFLIDEFGTGSDPELGGALAETFLEVFYERKSFGIITTHYANLKKMANETEGISNANMRFDSRSLEPKFKLQLGEAGSSFTFEVAQKNGIPYSLINRSKKKVQRGKIRFDKSIAKLQQQRSKLAHTTKKLNQEKLKTQENKEDLSHTNNRIQQKLENFQELYDSYQQSIHLGQKLDKLNQQYFSSNNKKRFIAETLKLAAIENSNRKEQTQKEQERAQKQREKIKKEAEEKLKPIRQKKKIKKKQEAQHHKAQEKRRIESLKVNDQVRLEGTQTVGTITKIEKGKAHINFGIITTETDLPKIELVKRAK